MSRYEYLKKLEGYLLRYLSREEVNEIMRDYGEYFSEGEQTGKTEAQIIAELGDPETAARQIILESKPGTAINFDSNTEKAKKAADEAAGFFKTTAGKIVIVVLAILTAPIWLSAVGSIIGAILAVAGVLFGLLGAGGIIIIAGIVLTVISIMLIPALPVSAIALLVVLSLGFISGGIFGIAITLILARLCWRLLVKLKGFIMQKTGRTPNGAANVKEETENA